MKMFSRRTYRFLRVILLCFLRICHPFVHVEGKENIPVSPAVICCNHSAFSDPIWVIAFADLPDLPRTMAKKELLKIPFLGWLYQKLGAFPVDRGGADIPAIKTAMKTLREGKKLLIFPEGTRIRKGKESVPHNGAALIAARTESPILPVYLTAKKKPFCRIHLIFGKPYRVDCSDRHPTEDELNSFSADLMQKIYQMGESL